MTAIPKIIFMFYRYRGFTCNSFDAFNEKITFSVGHLGFHAIEKNAQHLQVRIHQNWTQHILIDRKQQKTLYMSKNKVGWPLARTITYNALYSCTAPITNNNQSLQILYMVHAATQITRWRLSSRFVTPVLSCATS